MEQAWVVTGEDEVEAVLRSDVLWARPLGERVPKAMQGTPLAAIFDRLVRMNDGERHTTLRNEVEDRLATWDPEQVAAIARDAALRVAPSDIAGYSVATLIGIREPERVLPAIRDFAGAIAAGANDEAVAKGSTATQALLDALPSGLDRDEAANRLGFLFQTYAATAELIENRLNARTDAPALLTRRYAAADLEMFGKHIRKGDAIVVLLTAPRFHFGAGRHACPGRQIAETIAGAAVAVISANPDRISV